MRHMYDHGWTGVWLYSNEIYLTFFKDILIRTVEQEMGRVITR